MQGTADVFCSIFAPPVSSGRLAVPITLTTGELLDQVVVGVLWQADDVVEGDAAREQGDGVVWGEGAEIAALRGAYGFFCEDRPSLVVPPSKEPEVRLPGTMRVSRR